MSEQHQFVVLTFSDGTKATFSGKAVAYPGDSRTITDIEFTKPKDLPAGTYFGPLEEDPAHE